SAFHGVTWCMKYFDGYFTYLKFLVVLCNNGIKRWSGIWPINDRCAGLFRKVYMTRNEIGMKVCFEHVLNFCIVFFCFVNVRVHFAKRVNYHGLTIAFNVISALSQTPCIYLFYFHCPFCFIVQISFRELSYLVTFVTYTSSLYSFCLA